ncbi:type III secretion protein [Pseudomonas fluorescens]|uniref:type III secretion protein n=1 Tax=Pseudomonas fluorescens TaxID=294 RepID=UPI0017849684|nr:type III secretion protein [Pseudomonas fluorescens]MBD8194198.1 type III secretion protein [Pseudomonas fluorescens]MBD8228993.1 type III secretion protein [Pseudomonas fluorescens]MBD8787008.1 type III secretion protein [Pseudomonas fluorescens]MBD8819158.1 type III secretion protein [Pseudomonas fluorescens]
MKDSIRDWLSGHNEHISFYEGLDNITLKRQGQALLLGAQLTSTHSDNATHLLWLRLGAASVNHFQGALAQKADTGALWLVQSLRGGQGEAYVLNCLETLLNQRDTWRAVIKRLARPSRNFKPTSLRSLPF